MKVYSVMLEGRDQGKGFLITFDVASDSPENATNLAFCEATNLKLDIVGVEEIALKRVDSPDAGACVLKTYGKGFFDL
jgi:hypothetical protein